MVTVTHGKYFSELEFRCRCGCGDAGMDAQFVGMLDQLRESLGFALPVTSGYRCPDYNEKVSSTGRDGPHTQRRAVDIQIYGDRAYKLLAVALSLGFTGIGLSQHGQHDSRFVHLDWQIHGGPRPWVWTYS